MFICMDCQKLVLYKMCVKCVVWVRVSEKTWMNEKMYEMHYMNVEHKHNICWNKIIETINQADLSTHMKKKTYKRIMLFFYIE